MNFYVYDYCSKIVARGQKLSLKVPPRRPFLKWPILTRKPCRLQSKTTRATPSRMSTINVLGRRRRKRTGRGSFPSFPTGFWKEMVLQNWSVVRFLSARAISGAMFRLYHEFGKRREWAIHTRKYLYIFVLRSKFYVNKKQVLLCWMNVNCFLP